MMNRRRMLMSQQVSLEKAFETAMYITGGGHDIPSSEYAYIEQNKLLSNQKYYIFAYFIDNIAIFTYYNGVIKKIFEANSSVPLSLYKRNDVYRLYKNGGYFEARSVGMTVLTFQYDMDSVFSNLKIAGAIGANDSSCYREFTLSSYVPNKELRYFFVCNSSRFCVYKVKGPIKHTSGESAYLYLNSLFNYNLYLIKWNWENVALSYDNARGRELRGYTMLIIEG